MIAINDEVKFILKHKPNELVLVYNGKLVSSSELGRPIKRTDKESYLISKTTIGDMFKVFYEDLKINESKYIGVFLEKFISQETK